MSTKYVQTNTFYLAGSGVSVGATTITLTSLTDIYGNILTMTDFGSKGYITLEPDTNNEEGATFTGITANVNGTYTLTGVATILAKSPYTETSALVRQHAGGTKVVVTDNVAFWATFPNKNNAESISGVWAFTTGNTPTIADDPTTSIQAANKHYVDNVAIAGAPNASSTVKGISKLSIDPVSGTNPIAVGDNDTRVPTAGQAAALPGNNTDVAVGSGNKYVTQTGLQHNAEKYAADSGSSTAYVVALSPIPTSLTAGMVVYMKAANANTTTTPTLNVNSLGAKTIVKAVSTALLVGDIAANQFCTLQYDGTNFVLQNPTVADQTVAVYNQTVNTNPTSGSYHTYVAPMNVTSSSAITGWTVTSASYATLGPGAVQLGVNVNNMSLHAVPVPGGYVPNNGKSISIKWRALFVSANTGIFGFGLILQATPGSFFAAQTDVVAGVRFVNNAGTLYAQNANDTTATATDVTGSLSLNAMNTYEIVFTPGVSAKFYINGTLVATSTTNLPTSQTLDMGFGGSSNANAIQTFAPVVTIQT